MTLLSAYNHNKYNFSNVTGLYGGLPSDSKFDMFNPKFIYRQDIHK